MKLSVSEWAEVEFNYWCIRQMIDRAKSGDGTLESFEKEFEELAVIRGAFKHYPEATMMALEKMNEQRRMP